MLAPSVAMADTTCEEVAKIPGERFGFGNPAGQARQALRGLDSDPVANVAARLAATSGSIRT